jgi:hypothetical protein
VTIALLNGSPQPGPSASGFILQSLEKLLASGEEIVSLAKSGQFIDYDPRKLVRCRAAVLLFPLYVDGIPGEMLAFLEKWASIEANSPQTKLYPVINCGFYEPELINPALKVLRLFAAEARLTFGQALALGGGAMYSVLPAAIRRGPWPFGGLNRALKILAQSIRSGASGETLLVKPSLPPRLYAFLANQRWRLLALKNRIRRRPEANP